MAILKGLVDALNKNIDNKYKRKSSGSSTNGVSTSWSGIQRNTGLDNLIYRNVALQYNKEDENNLTENVVDKDNNQVHTNKFLATRDAQVLKSVFDVPAWGYKDFINERISWQKNLDSMLGDPVWYYFKIFFKFDSNYGLLGGILRDDEKTDSGFFNINTANKYLTRLMNSGRYKPESMQNRLASLQYFVKSLSWISSTTPWFFKSVKDVNNATTIDLGNITKEKTIEIECSEDATDMRLLTLFDLYRNAVYDDIHQKEIVPENLRKFDMDIVLFQAPIRYLHTSFKDLKNRSVNYKSLNDTNLSDRMSFKLFTFQNCEFVYESLNSSLPSSFTNENPFTSKPTFRITYDRVYQHTLNEFASVITGTSGTYRFADTANAQLRRSMIKYGLDNKRYYNSGATVYKALVEATEDTVSNAMRVISASTALGNLYGNYGVGSKYYNSKLSRLHKGYGSIDYSSVDSTNVLSTFGDYAKGMLNGYKNAAKNIWNTVKDIADTATLGLTGINGSGSSRAYGNMDTSLFSRSDSNPKEYKQGYSGNKKVISSQTAAENIGKMRQKFEYNHEMFKTLKGYTPKKHVEHHNV